MLHVFTFDIFTVTRVFSFLSVIGYTNHMVIVYYSGTQRVKYNSFIFIGSYDKLYRQQLTSTQYKIWHDIKQ